MKKTFRFLVTTLAILFGLSLHLLALPLTFLFLYIKMAWNASENILYRMDKFIDKMFDA